MISMQVTNVRVSFLREKQPAQFEKATPSVEFAATLDEGEDHEAAARQLMIDATRVVYNGIGYDVPARVVTALASGTVPSELSVTTETEETAPEAPEAAVEPTESSESKPKSRGRPKGSKNTRPKKGTKAAEEAEKAAGAAVSDESVPGEEAPSAISTGEPRVGPEDDPADHGIPGDEEVPGPTPQDQDPVDGTPEEFTPKDLHALIISLVQATPKRLSVANAKQILAHFKVARAQDLTNEQALEGKAMVEKMLAASEGG
jgi:hypothetical protein